MKGLYVTPRKAFADQHGGAFFWAVFRSILEIDQNLSVVMYDEFLDGYEIATRKSKIDNQYRGRVTSGADSEICTIELLSEADARPMSMTALKLQDGRLICDIYQASTLGSLSRSELFEPA